MTHTLNIHTQDQNGVLVRQDFKFRLDSSRQFSYAFEGFFSRSLFIFLTYSYEIGSYLFSIGGWVQRHSCS